MSAPSSDRAAIRQVIRALTGGGFSLLEVFDGEETIQVRTEKQALTAIMAVDDATLFVRTPLGDSNPWVRFVLGNDPDEVAADWIITLNPVMEPLTESWWR